MGFWVPQRARDLSWHPREESPWPAQDHSPESSTGDTAGPELSQQLSLPFWQELQVGQQKPALDNANTVQDRTLHSHSD